MDAGLAALLGAAVGSVATLGAAIVSGRTQTRAQNDQWRRQHRRDAYASYLSALHDRDIAMDAVLDTLRPDEPELLDVDEKIRRFIALAREVHRAADVVILEGPVSLVKVTERVADASSGLSEVMRRMADNARAGDVTRKAEDVTLAAERERILYQEVRAFRLAARAVIGNAA
ncbi:proline dehydrogenase [Streptomyces sp. NBC_00988]|uniref:proline dehydrogenase n=1 Tax=Streptomyces sp. NBC_00988 TaxID=2903704 RepID=UPI0038663DF7|nr:proline dehydrogenase [Streptomyces sp. NBC_00988]